MAILTISRQYGSGGRDIGRRVADSLGYRFVDKERLFNDLDGMGANWGRLARELDEVCPTLWERHDWQYRGYLAQLEALILGYAAEDRVVIIGRGASFLLRGTPHCLRVRVVAPLAVRLERVMVRESLGRQAAEKLITQVDRDRSSYLKINYGSEGEREAEYDLTLDTGSLTFEEAADILRKGLAAKEPLATPAAKAALERLALAYRLKAGIATDPRLLVPTLTVKVEGETLVISGVIHNPREIRLIKEISRQVVGDRAVRLDLRHRV